MATTVLQPIHTYKTKVYWVKSTFFDWDDHVHKHGQKSMYFFDVKIMVFPCHQPGKVWVLAHDSAPPHEVEFQLVLEVCEESQP